MSALFWRRLQRLKTIDSDYLHHTEWTRRLGAAQLMGVAGVVSLPLGVFVFIPYCVKFIAGPSCILSQILAFVLLILAGMHLIELCSAMPKSSVLYNFTYASAGEVWAFLLGWASCLDYAIAITVTARAWSAHSNLLFNSSIHKHVIFKIPVKYQQFLADHFDALAFGGICVAALLLLLSLRVASTVSVILLIVAALIVSSSVLVGFFYANPMHWLKPGFFPNGYVGILQGTSCLLYSYVGLETLLFVIDETCQPRKRIPAVFPLCNGLLSIYFFLIALVVTLATDYRQLNFEVLLPNVFDKVDVPAAKYILTVGSVCGLSGSLLAIFLPVTRQLVCMAQDRLIPAKLQNMGTKSGSPYWAILLAVVVSSAFLCLSSHTLLSVLCVSVPIRLTIAVLLTIPQHFTASPIGLSAETAAYRHMRRKHSMTSYLTANGSVSTLARSDTFYDDQYSISSSQICRSIAIQQGLTLDASNERSSLLLEDTVVPKSISKYNAILGEDGEKQPERPPENASMHTVSLGPPPTVSATSHNCLKSPCSPADTSVADETRNFHLYDREIPELPYYADSNYARRGSTPVDQPLEWQKAKRHLLIFVFLTFGTALVADKLEWAVNAGNWFVIGLLCVLLVAVLTSGSFLCCVETNRKLPPRKNSVTGFPALSLLTLFLLALVLCANPLLTYARLIVWLLIGVPVYLLYGYRFSRENRRDTNDLVLENAQVEKEAIVPHAQSVANTSITS